jgi:phosphatidate cytidylyltransferase
MKKRLISVSVGMVLLAALMYWIDTWVLNVALAAAGGIAVYEVLRAFKLHDKILFLAVFIGLHVLNMFLSIEPFYFVYLMIFLMFLLAMSKIGRHYTYRECAAVTAAVLMITLGLRAILDMRETLRCAHPAENAGDARFMLFVCFGLGWICDTFAFSFGKWLGKKKMCPEISPNKTVAGGIAGLIGTPLVMMLAFYIYSVAGAPPSVFYAMNEPLHLFFYFLVGLIGAAIGIIGDLAASFIKRECGLKDFGGIMPGHGGAFDRLDSVLFTSVFAALSLEIFLKLFSAAPAA